MAQIEGVRVKVLQRHSDDRGWLYEGLKSTDPEFQGFGQTNVTLTYPGVVKAFHWHRLQTDYWTVLKGAIEVRLFDLRGNLEEHQIWSRLVQNRFVLPEEYAGQSSAELRAMAGDRKQRLREFQEENSQVVYLNELEPKVLTIPPGVAHGYRVLGDEPALLMYHVTHPYNPREPDEERIPWDDWVIGSDWKTQNR